MLSRQMNSRYSPSSMWLVWQSADSYPPHDFSKIPQADSMVPCVTRLQTATSRTTTISRVTFSLPLAW
jgi:hypothetical protein